MKTLTDFRKTVETCVDPRLIILYLKDLKILSMFLMFALPCICKGSENLIND